MIVEGDVLSQLSGYRKLASVRASRLASKIAHDHALKVLLHRGSIASKLGLVERRFEFVQSECQLLHGEPSTPLSLGSRRGVSLTVARYNTKRDTPVEPLQGLAEALSRPDPSQRPKHPRKPRSRFTEAQIEAMRQDREVGMLYHEIASKYGVSKGHAHRLITGTKSRS